MTIYTMGFTKKSAESFFEAIRSNGIRLLIDVRLNNKSQLAGFTKGSDLEYFLRTICETEYIHCEEYAPTKELLSGYQKKEVSWDEYTKVYHEIMERRGAYKKFLERFEKYERVCLLCSEPTPEQCHRRLFAEMVKKENDTEVEIIHI